MVMFIDILVFSKFSSLRYFTKGFEIVWQDEADDLWENSFSPLWHCIMCFPLMVNPICKQMCVHVDNTFICVSKQNLHEYSSLNTSHWSMQTVSPFFNKSQSHLPLGGSSGKEHPWHLLISCIWWLIIIWHNLIASCDGNHPVFVHTVTLPL